MNVILCTKDNTHIIFFNPNYAKIRYYHLYFINGDSVTLSIVSKFTELMRSRSRILTTTVSHSFPLPTVVEKSINVSVLIISPFSLAMLTQINH